MKWKITDLRKCLNLIGIIILLVGLGSAALIYSTAENDSKNKILPRRKKNDGFDPDL